MGTDGDFTNKLVIIVRKLNEHLEGTCDVM